MVQLKVYPSVGAPVNSCVFLDLYETQPIKLTLSIEDITSADATSVFSRTFKVPATRDNNEFFENAFELDGIDFDITIKKPAEILVDGAEFKTGHVRLQKIFTNEDQDKIDYELLFLGETRDFSSAVGETTMCQLQFTDFSWDDLPVSYTNAADFTAGIGAQEVQDSWDAFPQGNTPTSGYADGDLLFPLIDHGNNYQGENLNSPTVSIGSNGSQEQSFTHSSHALPASRFKPMVRAKRLWDQIFENSGYTYESNFLDSEQFLHMYVSAFGNEENINIGVEQDLGAGVFGTASSQTFEYFEQPNGNNDVNSYLYCSNQVVSAPNYYVNITDVGSSNGGSYFIAPGNASLGGAFYAFEYGAQVDAQIENSDYGYTAVDCAVQLCVVDAVGGNILQTLDTGNFASNGNWSSSSFTTQNGGYQIQAGDIIQIYITNAYSYDISQVDQAYWQCTAAPGAYSPARDLDCEYQQIDFIKDIITMFRLVMQPSVDRANHFIIEPWKDFIGSGDVYDWSHKLIREKDFVSEPLFNTQSAQIEFTKQEDEDYINKFHQDNNKHAYGWLRFDSQNELLKGKREVEVLGIAPTPIEQIVDTQGSQAHTNPDFIIPQIFEVDDNKRLPIKPKTRFLFYNGMVTTNGTTWYFKTTGTTQIAMVTYPLVSPYEYWPITNIPFDAGPPVVEAVNTLNLNFANDTRYYMDPTPSASLTEIPNTLFEIFWARYITSLYNKFSRRITAYFTLNNVDLQNLTFDDIIFIDGKYYRPEKIIDAQIGERTAVKCELITVKDQRIVWRPDPLTGFSIVAQDGQCAGESGSIQVTTDGTPPFTWAIGDLSQGQPPTMTGTYNANPGQAPYIFTIENVPLGIDTLTVVDNFGRSAVASFEISASTATPVTASFTVTDATGCGQAPSPTVFLDVSSTTQTPLGESATGTPPSQNGYIHGEVVAVDTFNSWNYYGSDELWFSNTTVLDVTKDVTIEGSITIGIGTGANQAEWDEFLDRVLGVNTSNSANFPGAPGEPVFFQMSDVLPATVPAVGTQIVVPFSQNIGPVTPINPSQSYQSIGVMIANLAANRPPVIGPIYSWLTQDASRLIFSYDDPTACNGEVDVVPAGGVAPYTITWEAGLTGLNPTGLCPDDYRFYITDSNGCQSDMYEASVSCVTPTNNFLLKELLNNCTALSAQDYIADSTIQLSQGDIVSLGTGRAGCYQVMGTTQLAANYMVDADYATCADCVPSTPNSYEVQSCTTQDVMFISRSPYTLQPGNIVTLQEAAGCWEVVGDDTAQPTDTATQIYKSCELCNGVGYSYLFVFCDGSGTGVYRFTSNVQLSLGDVVKVQDSTVPSYIGKCVEVVAETISGTIYGDVDDSPQYDDCSSCQGITPQTCHTVNVTGAGAEISYVLNNASYTEALLVGTYQRCGTNFQLLSGTATFGTGTLPCISPLDCSIRFKTSCHTLYGANAGATFEYQDTNGTFQTLFVPPFQQVDKCVVINSVTVLSGSGQYFDNMTRCQDDFDCTIPAPDECLGYEITNDTGSTGNYTYETCEGQTQAGLLLSGNSVYICSRVIPLTSAGLTVGISPVDCP